MRTTVNRTYTRLLPYVDTFCGHDFLWTLFSSSGASRCREAPDEILWLLDVEVSLEGLRMRRLCELKC